MQDKWVPQQEVDVMEEEQSAGESGGMSDVHAVPGEGIGEGVQGYRRHYLGKEGGHQRHSHMITWVHRHSDTTAF